jgi:hypothetical protein
VNVPGASRVFRFKPVKRAVKANAETRLRLKLARKPLRAVKRRLKRRKKLLGQGDRDSNGRGGQRRSIAAVDPAASVAGTQQARPEARLCMLQNLPCGPVA